MSAIATAPARERVTAAERISWLRVLWVAPLTLIVAVGLCMGIRAAAQSIDPTLQRMGQLGPAMTTLAVEGSLAAIGVFVLFALFVPRPIFWFRVVGVIALVLSWMPDVALGIGGSAAGTAMRYVGPLTSIGVSSGPRPSGPPPSGPPPGAFSGQPIEHVLILMLLHTVVAAVCIGLLTTLTVSKPRSLRGG